MLSMPARRKGNVKRIWSDVTGVNFIPSRNPKAQGGTLVFILSCGHTLRKRACLGRDFKQKICRGCERLRDRNTNTK